MKSKVSIIIITSLILLSCEINFGNTGKNYLNGDRIQYCVITVDVEALPHRQSTDHVQRLIYGRFGSGKSAGIDEMMDIADKYNVKISFFLDVLEETIYPGEIRKVAEHIVERGHDLQLHTHPLIVPAQFWRKIGVEKKLSDSLTDTEARGLFQEIEAMIEDWKIPHPVAYRAGSYRYSKGIIDVLPEFGIEYSYNYNVRGRSQRDLNDGLLPLFSWENGVIEIPVSYVNRNGEQVLFREHSYLRTKNIDDAYDDINSFMGMWQTDNVLVMMMHSWSFLYLNSKRHRVYHSDRKVKRFDAFLRNLPDNVKIVSASEIKNLVDNGELIIEKTKNTSDLF